MELRRIDVLLDKKTNEEFHKGDIVKITVKSSYNREYIGKVTWIETLEITLDTSEKYNSNECKIKYDDILEIELV